MPILLDTSFIIAFDNVKDIHHKKARDLWSKIENMEHGLYFISDYIFDEIIAVSMRKTDKNSTIHLGQKLLNSIPLITIDNLTFNDTWKLFKETKENLSFTDCTNLVLLKLMSSKKIATFDKGFNDIKDVELINN